jgi:hypothetical protein
MAEDVHIGDCGLPQLRLQETACRRCGNPILNVGGLCVQCMNLGFIDEALQQQIQIFRDHPRAQLVIAKDEKKKPHAILVGHPKWAYCGIKPTETVAKRKQTSPEHLPLDLCARCRELVDRAWKGASES